MAPEIKNQPTVAAPDQPVDDSNEHYRPVIERNAGDRAGFTRRSFEAIGKSLTEFLAKIKKPPYNIEIDENDDKSLAYGIFCFQRKLGPPEVENDFLHDGMCGPATLRKFNEVKLHQQNTGALHDLSSQLPVAPPKPEVPEAAPTRTDAPVQELVKTPVAPRIPENNNVLPETNIHSWLFVGDSLTVGMKSTGALNGSIEPKKYRDENNKLQGISIGGKQSPAMLGALNHAEQNNEIADGKGMVVWAGINDIGSARSTKQIIATLTQIYKFAEQKNMTVVACTMPDWRPSEATLKEYDRRWKEKGMGKYPFTADETVARIHVVNDWIRNNAQKVVPNTKLHVVDLNAELRRNPKTYHYNESILHPTNGYTAIAEYITTQANIKRQTSVAQK